MIPACGYIYISLGLVILCLIASGKQIGVSYGEVEYIVAEEEKVVSCHLPDKAYVFLGCCLFKVLQVVQEFFVVVA